MIGLWCILSWYVCEDIRPPRCEWASFNLLKAWIEQNIRARKDLFLFFLSTWSGTSVFTCIWTRIYIISSSGFLALDSDWNYTSSFSGSPACRQKIKRFLSLIYLSIHPPIFLSIFYLALTVLFLWRMLIHHLYLNTCNVLHVYTYIYTYICFPSYKYLILIYDLVYCEIRLCLKKCLCH